MNKVIISLILAIVIVIGGLIGYGVTHETIDAGYVGYVYDRTASPTVASSSLAPVHNLEIVVKW